MLGLDATRGNALEESSEDAPRWHGEPVYVYSGDILELAPLIPFFERQPFGTSDGEKPAGDARTRRLRASGENKLWDVIVRKPLFKEDKPTPVGIVSKHYNLVQHRDLFRKATEALEKAGIQTGECKAELMLSAYGTRMALIFELPEKFSFDPGDHMPLALRFYGVNSVDASSRLTIMFGWFRFICCNGLVVGTAQLSQKFVHNEHLELPDLPEVLAQGISLAEKEKVTLQGWIKKEVSLGRVEQWIDSKVRDSWGPLAAARTYHICRTGKDAQFANHAEKALPHIKKMIPTVDVPGAPPEARNAYHICQALSWVAKERRQIQDQLGGMQQLPELMEALLR